MKHTIALITFLALSISATFAAGASSVSVPLPEPASLPAMGTAPWGDDPLSRARLNGAKEGKFTLTQVADHGTRLATVLEFRAGQAFDGEPWGLQVTIPSTANLNKGSTLFFEVYIRTLGTKAENGEGRTILNLEKRGQPFTKSVSKNVTAPPGGAWVRRCYSGVVKENYPAGGAQINFQLGFDRAQTIQIGGLRVVDLGPGVPPQSLPAETLTYPGREANAAWRAKAAQRIEQYRKGDLIIAVVDAAGKPVNGARVQVTMTKPDFAFGSAVAPDAIVEKSADGDRYRAWIKENCTRVVIENHLKWPAWENGLRPNAPPKQRNRTTLEGLAWLNQEGIEIKGHNLIWPSWHNSPKRLEALANDPVALRKACEDRIASALKATAPYHLVSWDVVNEAYANHDILDILGPRIMSDWFTQARREFPNGDLLYNDYAHLTSAGSSRFKGAVEKIVKDLKASGAPITGMGIQSHVGESMINPADVVAELDRLAAELQINLSITEFDAKVSDDQAHADFTRDFITACFANPHVTSFLAWGFWETRHWIPEAAMLRKDWTERPAAEVWHDLFKRDWWTNLSGATDAKGTWQGRGFRGLHTITVTVAGKSTMVTAQIDGQPQTVTVRVNNQ
ncbi:MAG: endo-1,4-beta-xylanase [Verrucomicrobiota bacterium]